MIRNREVFHRAAVHFLWKCFVDARGQRKMARLVWADRKASKHPLQPIYAEEQLNTQHVEPWSRWTTTTQDHRSATCKNRKIKLQFTLAHQNWTVEDWKKVVWSDESYWAVVGLMDRALDLKPEITQGCGFESRLRQDVHDCSPGAAQSAAHCSKCVHLDGLNAENTFHSSLYSV